MQLAWTGTRRTYTGFSYSDVLVNCCLLYSDSESDTGKSHAVAIRPSFAPECTAVRADASRLHVWGTSSHEPPLLVVARGRPCRLRIVANGFARSYLTIVPDASSCVLHREAAAFRARREAGERFGHRIWGTSSAFFELPCFFRRLHVCNLTSAQHHLVA